MPLPWQHQELPTQQPVTTNYSQINFSLNGISRLLSLISVNVTVTAAEHHNFIYLFIFFKWTFRVADSK